MKPGDLCRIWNGNSSIYDSKNWLVGIVMKEKKNRYWDSSRFQVFWNDGCVDETWYTEDEIRFDK